jgi:single-strand selective monofunctional uracil DNA glycosylase
MSAALIKISRELSKSVNSLKFSSPVAFVYNPLTYAWQAHEAYLSRYGSGRKRVLLIGMNPGPFGMVQTGVPFGDVQAVRDWLGIDTPVGRPEVMHPKRPVLGFACERREVSGSRLWGWAQARFAAPAKFFQDFFVVNYCPLAFMEASGRNLTPDKLPAAERGPLFESCDRALFQIVEALEPAFVIGVGGFAEQRARTALAESAVQIGTILHPSPASPKANRNWAGVAEEQLRGYGVRI